MQRIIITEWRCYIVAEKHNPSKEKMLPENRENLKQLEHMPEKCT